MELEISITGADLLEEIYDMIGTDFDSLSEFTKALTNCGPIAVKGKVDRYELEEAVTDEWIDAQYKERFDGGDHRNTRDEKNAVAELSAGNRLVARALFDRAGREDLSRAI